MAPEKAAGEDLSMRRRRLKYRAAHRGTRELDMLIGVFAEAKADVMDAGELDRLERLLDEGETELQAWLLGQEVPPPDVDRDLLERIIAHKISITTR
ncbi:MAG TPA: succinate dehydrogenase assembly factor 2 [Devosia sp.]|nr:succinate dehydrogenase assembly factor 2 [Devosia sp.]